MARRSCLGAGRVNILGNNLLGSRTLSAEHRDLQFTAAVSASKLVQADALKKIPSRYLARQNACRAYGPQKNKRKRLLLSGWRCPLKAETGVRFP